MGLLGIQSVFVVREGRSRRRKCRTLESDTVVGEIFWGAGFELESAALEFLFVIGWVRCRGRMWEVGNELRGRNGGVGERRCAGWVVSVNGCAGRGVYCMV